MTNEREQDGLREELEGPDTTAYATTAAGAGGEPGRDEDRAQAMQMGESPTRISGRPDVEAVRESAGDAEADPIDSDEAIIGPAGTGGAGPGFIAPSPGADWPDPLGSDDDDRELERRTR
jgi:hypothetical protein